MKVEYTEFKGLFQAGEYSDFAFFKNAYNVSFAKEGTIQAPPEFSPYKKYDGEILKFSKFRVPYLFEGKEVNFAFLKKGFDYTIDYDINKFKFSTFPQAVGRTIDETTANNLGIDLTLNSNWHKFILRKSDNLDFVNKAKELINDNGFCYVIAETNGDFYLERYFLFYSYEETSDYITFYSTGGKFRKYFYSIYGYANGIPQNTANIYNQLLYLFDNNLFDKAWKWLDVGVVDYKIYPYPNGLRIHRLYSDIYEEDKTYNLDFRLPGAVKFLKGIYSFPIKRGGISNLDFNLVDSNDDLRSPYDYYPKFHWYFGNEYSKPVNNFNKLYAVSYTAVLTTGDEIPLAIECTFESSPYHHEVMTAKKMFFLQPSFYSIFNLTMFNGSLKMALIPLSVEYVNVYVAEISENLREWSSDGTTLYYYDAEKIPDTYFTLKARIKNFRPFYGGIGEKEGIGELEIVETDITLADLPTWGTKWVVKLYDETKYGNAIIGVGKDNVLYESQSLSEGVMSEIIPEENFTILNLIGKIKKIEVFAYRLLVFTENEILVLDPEKNYQIINRLNVGLLNRFSVTQTPFGIVFVSTQGVVYLTDGVRLQEISGAIGEIIKMFYYLTHKIVYYSGENELWILAGRHIFVYHFNLQKWSIYANAKSINDAFVGDGFYLVSMKSEVYRLDYSRRSLNGDKMFLISYKNKLGTDEPKILNFVEFIVKSDDFYVLLKTDTMVMGYRIKNNYNRQVRLTLPNKFFKWLQIAIFSLDCYGLEKISVDYSNANVNYASSLQEFGFDGVVFTCFNEFAGFKKNTVFKFDKLSKFPSFPERLNIDISEVYDATFKKLRYGTGERLDFEYTILQLRSFLPKVKNILVFSTVLWTSFNSVGQTDDTDFSETSKIYTDPIKPPNMPYIFPTISYQGIILGRGGWTGQWENYSGSIYRYRIWSCLWVYYNSGNKARRTDGTWVDFVKRNSLNGLANVESGWFFDDVNGYLYVKFPSGINPDLEQIQIVEKHPIRWSASDGIYWSYNQNFEPFSHFRMPHPTSGGSIDDYVLCDIIKYLQSLGYNVGFYPFLMVSNSQGHGWRGYIRKFDTNVANDYKNWILHYAKLFQNRQVTPDIFILGSEMKELEKNVDFANLIIYLANQVKMLLPNTKVTYAMDWGSIVEILNGDTSRNYFENNVWNAMDYLGIDLYHPLLNIGERYVYNPHKGINNISNFIKNWYLRHPKPVIVTEYGISSVDKSLYAPYIFPPNLPPTSDGSIDEISQYIGYQAFHYHFADLMKKGIVKRYYFYNFDIRPFPSYPDSYVYDWINLIPYYEDYFRFPTGHNINAKLTMYMLNDI